MSLFTCPSCNQPICIDNCDCPGSCRCGLAPNLIPTCESIKQLLPENPEEIVAFLKDMNGRYVSVSNPHSIFGVRAGYTDTETFGMSVAEQARQIEYEVIGDNKTAEIIMRVDTDHGTQYWHSIKFPVRNADGKVFVAGYCANVTGLVSASPLPN